MKLFGWWSPGEVKKLRRKHERENSIRFELAAAALNSTIKDRDRDREELGWAIAERDAATSERERILTQLNKLRAVIDRAKDNGLLECEGCGALGREDYGMDAEGNWFCSDCGDVLLQDALVEEEPEIGGEG